MDSIFSTGLIGAVVLVAGAAWPESKRKYRIQSLKNWLLALGALLLFLYALLAWIFQGGAIFFVFLESLVVVASVLMVAEVDERKSTIGVGLAGVIFLIWSLFLFEGTSTVFFIIGLSSISMGYIFSKTAPRNTALLLGSILISLFSYLEANGIFFWLNLFFALFALYYLARALVYFLRT